MKRLLLFGAIVAALTTIADSGSIDPILRTSSGTFVGQKVFMPSGHSVMSFLGVPFAQAPIGELRFEKPVDVANISQEYHLAREFKPTCIQMKHFTEAISPLLDVDEDHNISEDCLYLNIYVPDVSNAQALPIMVWLPGEGFDFADVRQFNGAFLASMGKVVVITVQYRVGVFGFLKHNLAIYDQLKALEWIHKNADNLNGDASNVTLFGRFTGSMSISILLSSKPSIESSVPLFTRAILMSGIAVGNWVFDQKHDDKVRKLYADTQCKDLKCLKELPVQTLLAKSGFGWKPVKDNVLIDDEPLDALKNGKFPKYVDSIMLGTNQFEGNICLLKHMVVDKPFYDKLVSNNVTTNEYTNAIKQDLEMFYEDKMHQNRQKYTSGIITDRAKYVQFCSELLINSNMQDYKHLLNTKIVSNPAYNLKNVFNYKLDYKPSFSIAPEFINSSIHGDDVILAFGLAFKQNMQASKDDQQISGKMVSIFSNFAQSGIPFAKSLEAPIAYFEIKINSESISEYDFGSFCLEFGLLFGSLALAIYFGLKLVKHYSVSQPSVKRLVNSYNECC